MSTLPRPTVRLAVVASFVVFLAAACSPDSNGPSGPTLHRDRHQGGGAAAAGFTVLADAAVTCTNGTITGDVGTFQASPTGSFTQTTCPLTGTAHVGDAAAIAAYNAFLTAYTALTPQPNDACPIITGTLAGQSFAPGVYCVSAEAKTGVLTLNGPPNGTWVFKVAPGAFTGTSFQVVMAGGAQPCNVTWWVDAAATLTDSDLKGNVLAGAAITLTRGTFAGNAWAKAGVTITGTAIVGCATAGTPPPEQCRTADRVTGGGWIRGPTGAKAEFAVAGGTRRGDFWGHLQFEDKGSKGKSNDVRVKGTRVTAYVIVDGVTRHIEGTAKLNGRSGFTYQVDVTDNGRRGRHDTFSLRLSNGYTASGTLRGGNIQLHRSHARSCRDHDRDDDDCDDDHDDDGDDDDDKGHGNKGHGDKDDDN